MTIELVYGQNYWLNAFPPNDGVSSTISPRTLITGQQIQYGKHMTIEFGAYAQIHEEGDNTMTSRTTGALALRPTGNIQGGYYFFSLSSGRRIVA